MHYHILDYKLSTPENVDVVQLTNFTEKMEALFFDPDLTTRDKDGRTGLTTIYPNFL